MQKSRLAYSRPSRIKPFPGRHMPCWASAAPQHPGWAGVVLLPDWANAPLPGWADVLAPARPPGRVCRLGRCLRPRLGLLAECAGWAGAFSPGWAGVSSPAGPGYSSPAGPVSSRQTSFLRVSAGPGRDSPGPGRDSSCQARLFLPWPNLSLGGRDLPPPGHIIHPASTTSPYASPRTLLGSDWHILHRYAGLRIPLGSDQHTPHLLVSLILRRRIRLMAWRHTLEDEDQVLQGQSRWDKPMTMTPAIVPSTVPQ
jgi:hypothetical protein